LKLCRWNVDFSNVSVATGLSSFTIQRINQLEVALLSILRFDVRVPASEYAKYYFLIRTMLFRGGHSGKGNQIPSTAAAKLLTSGVAGAAGVDNSTINRRTRSVDWATGPIFNDAQSLSHLLSQQGGQESS
jgi:hypothetical protein